MKQVAILSGKGGTGKTTLTASFAALAKRPVVADCDVEAADLALLIPPTNKKVNEFHAGFKAIVNRAACTRCGVCVGVCRFNAISPDIVIDPLRCEGCGVCVDYCPEHAIFEDEQLAGHWYEADTEFGPMLYAQIDAGQENSGKLVAQVRKRALERAEEGGHEIVLIDGPPGIGCPVISALTGVDLVVLVTEPSPSGLHDLDRVLELTRHFKIPALVVLNKADLALDYAAHMVECIEANGARLIGRLPYDQSALEAVAAAEPVVRHGTGPLTTAIEDVWKVIEEELTTAN